MNAPFALVGGRTPVRVVTRGAGRLTVGDLHCTVAGDTDRIFLVPVLNKVSVRLRNFHGHASKERALQGHARSAPERIQLPHDEEQRFGPRLPDAIKNSTHTLAVPSPRAAVVALPPLRPVRLAPLAALRALAALPQRSVLQAQRLSPKLTLPLRRQTVIDGYAGSQQGFSTRAPDPERIHSERNHLERVHSERSPSRTQPSRAHPNPQQGEPS